MIYRLFVLPCWKAINNMLPWRSGESCHGQRHFCLNRQNRNHQHINEKLLKRLGIQRLPDRQTQDYIDAKLHRIAEKSKTIKKKKQLSQMTSLLPQGWDKFDPLFYHPALLNNVQFLENQGWEMKD